MSHLSIKPQRGHFCYTATLQVVFLNIINNHNPPIWSDKNRRYMYFFTRIFSNGGLAGWVQTVKLVNKDFLKEELRVRKENWYRSYVCSLINVLYKTDKDGDAGAIFRGSFVSSVQIIKVVSFNSSLKNKWVRLQENILLSHWKQQK